MSHYTETLQEISKRTEQLLMSAPAEDVSRLRHEITRLSSATSRMGRALSAAPNCVETTKVARFSITAQGASDTIEGLIRLIGHGDNADDPDAEAEKDLAVVIDALMAAADAARKSATATFRNDIQASAMAVASWSLEEEPTKAVATSDIHSDDLADAFTSADTLLPSVHAPQKKTLLGFIPFKPKSVAPKKASRSQEITRALVDDLMKRSSRRNDVNQVWTDSGMFDDSFRAENPALVERGLFLDIDRHHATFSLRNEAPKVMTPMWDQIAKAAAGDAKALHRALLFKDKPEFRSALRSEAIRMLNEMEEMTQAGVPLPQSKMRDPVLGAAIFATLSHMGYTRLNPHKVDKNPEFDPFGIRKNLNAVLTLNEGLAVYPMVGKGVLALMTKESAITPTGTSAILNKTVMAFNEQTSSLLYRLQDKRGEGCLLSLRGEAVLAVPDLAENVREAITAYGNMRGYTDDYEQELDLLFEPLAVLGHYQMRATPESLKLAAEMEEDYMDNGF